MVEETVYPVFEFQDPGDKDDIFMILDKRLQDEGYTQWLRTPTVGDGPSYSDIMDCHKKEGSPAISMKEAFEINLEFANAILVFVHVIRKGYRTRSLMASAEMIHAKDAL